MTKAMPDIQDDAFTDQPSMAATRFHRKNVCKRTVDKSASLGSVVSVGLMGYYETSNQAPFLFASA